MSELMINYRKLFEGIDNEITLLDGRNVLPINFDNGATTPSFKQVADCVFNSLQRYGSIGRGKGQNSEYCNRVYEEARQNILNFFNLGNSQEYTVIYVKNTTEGLNLLAETLVTGKYDKILTTRMEHHANDLPWRKRGVVEYIEVDDLGKINIDLIEEKLIKAKGSIKYITITGASNVTGYLNPINKIAMIAHKYGARIIVDAAQLVAHRKINMKGTGNNDNIDFLVFSAHKMYAPFGSGAIVGLKSELENKEPFLRGGGAVEVVLDNKIYWTDLPDKYEPGTPNFLGVVAMSSAFSELSEITMEAVEVHEKILANYLLREITKINKIMMYGDINEINRLGVFPFNVEGINHKDVADDLALLRGISVRNGWFCAHPYVKRLLGVGDNELLKYIKEPDIKRMGMVRVSFGLYNQTNEIDDFLAALEYIISKRS